MKWTKDSPLHAKFPLCRFLRQSPMFQQYRTMNPPDDERGLDHNTEEEVDEETEEDKEMEEDVYDEDRVEFFMTRHHHTMTEYYTMSDSDVDDDGGFFFDPEDFLGIGALFPPVKRRWRQILWEARFSAINDADIIFVADASAEESRALRLEEGLWSTLYEELVHMILFRLPWAAQCRFRCVCSQWNLVLSSSAPSLTENPRNYRSCCTVRSEGYHAGRMVAFCHDENKWFDVYYPVLPPSANAWDFMPKKTKARAASLFGMDSPTLLLIHWVLADVDGEYFCYHCYEVTGHWIAVCNPMIPQSTLLLPPNPWDIQEAYFTKLLVDREARTFKVVVMTLDVTAIFDSVSVEWTHYESFQLLARLPVRAFVWKGSVYVHDAYVYLHTLDVVSGTWTQVISTLGGQDEGQELPAEAEDFKKFCMVSSKDQVMLVQVNFDNDEFISIWKMLNDDPGNVIPFSASSWVKQNIALPKAIKILALDFRDCTSHGGDYICFNGGWSYHWIKYSFSKRQWTVFPWRGDPICEVVPALHWFDWEPGLEGNLKSDHHWEY